MPTNNYFNSKGDKLPGNTTVIGSNLGWSKNALVYWAWAQGKQGLDFRQTRDAAADIGTVAHEMCECDIKGTKLDAKYSADLVASATPAFENFLEWKSMVKFELLDMEVMCISEILQVGTTVDIVSRVNGKRSLTEIKTSNAVHEDYLIQMACQKQCWDETFPDKPIEEFHLLR